MTNHNSYQSRLRRLTFASMVLAMSICLSAASGCDREDDNLITEPTETSTVITGYIKTPEGDPLAGIPVNVDFTSNGIFGSSLIHKAKGSTDKKGFFRIFFEADENMGSGLNRGYKFTVDLSVLSSDDFIIAEKLEFPFMNFPEQWSGETYKCNFSIPHKKQVKVNVSNPGEKVEGGRYAVKNEFPYMSGGLNRNEPVLFYSVFEDIDIPQRGDVKVMVPYAVGADNSLGVVYMGNDTVLFRSGRPVSDIIEIKAGEKPTGDINLIYTGRDPSEL